MAWNKFLHILLGSTLMLAESIKAPAPATSPLKVGIEEILSYECARSVTSLVRASDQMGPLFSDGRLVFTSLEANDTTVMLLVNAGYGNFVITLESTGVNRLRFQVPTGQKSGSGTFYLSYLHGGAMRSRYFEYSEGHPPAGREDVEYALVVPRRADYLLPHFDYAIHETAEATLKEITDGRLSRDQLNRHKVENCDHISRQAPTIAKNLRHNIDELDMIVMGPGASGSGGVVAATAAQPVPKHPWPASAGPGRSPASEMGAKPRVVSITTLPH
jgi:hypothetical protein